MSERSEYPAGVPLWVDLTTTDPEAAMTFYEQLFGWELDRGAPEFGGYTMCRLRGRRVAGINGQPGPEGMLPTWITYLSSQDVDATATRVTEAGGERFMGPMDVADQGRLLIGRDPLGALIGFWQPRVHVGAEIVNEPGALSWNELLTPDLDEAAAFYAAVCGHHYDEEDTGPDGPAYRTFLVDDRPVGGMLATDDLQGRPPQWIPYFAVANIDDATRLVSELGGRVHGDPVDSPYGRWSTITDPQGAWLRLVTLPEDLDVG